jgi:hypothetical protein
MRFLSRTAGYTRWDHKRNEDILTELQMSHITDSHISIGKIGKSMLTGSKKLILKYELCSSYFFFCSFLTSNEVFEKRTVLSAETLRLDLVLYSRR